MFSYGTDTAQRTHGQSAQRTGFGRVMISMLSQQNLSTRQLRKTVGKQMGLTNDFSANIRA
jgi:adenylosuccinate lyase